MIDKQILSIFQKGSRTYFYSSLFFPTKVRQDVFKLYAFVRKADNYVDSIPQNSKGFINFKEKYESALNGSQVEDIVINSFIELSNEKKFQKEWIEAFFKSMEMDITKKRYETTDETLEYIYGSAEVIGLMMAKIIDLPNESHLHAQMLGRAMQYINFIRDIQEDIILGRTYIPYQEYNKYGLKNLSYVEAKKQPKNYISFIEEQIKKFCKWQELAEEGFTYIPKKYLISIKTASEMYKWTANQILKNPFILYQFKVKPLIGKIITTTIANMINIQTKKYDSKVCNLNFK